MRINVVSHGFLLKQFISDELFIQKGSGADNQITLFVIDLFSTEFDSDIEMISCLSTFSME